MSTDNIKYVLTDYTEPVYDIYKGEYIILHRIKALRDFGDVKAGDLGGYIEDELNLSTYIDDKCWIYDNSKAYGNARVYGDAVVKNDSCICGNAIVCNHTVIDNSFVTENALACCHARVLDNSSVSGDATIYGDTLIYGGSTVKGCAKIHGKSRIYGGIIVDNVGEVEDGEIYDQATLEKYLPNKLELRDELGDAINEMKIFARLKDIPVITCSHLNGGENKMSTDKKYELTDATIYADGEGTKILHRIRALKDFSDVKAGDLGGLVESEDNLSQEENCWVYDDSKVYEDAKVCGNVKIKGDTEVLGYAIICGEVVVNDSIVKDDAIITGFAQILKSKIFGNAFVCGNAKIYDLCYVYDNSNIYGNSEICENSVIGGNAWIGGDSKISGGVIIHPYKKIIFRDVEIHDYETMNKYLLMQLKKEVSKSMEKVNFVFGNDVEVKNMDDMVKDNYGSLNKVLEALYGQGPYTAYQVEYAMNMYKNKDEHDKNKNPNNEDPVYIDIYIDIVSRGYAQIPLTFDQYDSYDIDDMCRYAQKMLNKKELDVDWSDDTVVRLKILDRKTGKLSNTVSFDPNHSNNN